MRMVQTFLWVVVGLLAVQLVLLAVLIVGKQKALKRQRKIAWVKGQVMPIYRQFIEAPEQKWMEPQLPSNKSIRQAAIEEMLIDFQETYKDQKERNRITDLAERHLAPRYQSILKNGGWAERINALYFIEDFRIASLKEEVFSHFKSLAKQDDEYWQCLRAAAILQEPKVVDVLFEESNLSVGFAKELLMRMDEELHQRIMARMFMKDDAPENLLYAFIMLNGERKSERFFPFVEKLMTDERKEVRIKAMKSLTHYGRLSDPQKLSAFFISLFWEERMYAAKLAGACKLTDFKEQLIQLFTDPVWWVRFAAADNLQEFEDGNALLHEIASTSEDAYARDVARHMLTKKGGGNR